MTLAYHILLKLLEPTSLCLILLLTAAAFRKRNILSRTCFWTVSGLLLVGGNGWVSGAMIRHLGGRYPGRNPVPQADCILVLSGGILSRLPPRQLMNFSEAMHEYLGIAYYRLRGWM